MLAPYDFSGSVKQPSNLTASGGSSRTAPLSNPNNVFSVQTATQSWSHRFASTTSAWDVPGRTIDTSTTPGQHSVRTLDAHGRTATLKQDPSMAAAAFTYDGKGLLEKLEFGPQTQTFGYNGNDRLTSSTNAAGTTEYGYDGAGFLISRRRPATTPTRTSATAWGGSRA